MNELAKSAFLNRPDLHIGTEGEFAGWRTWSRDAFETNNGPFWHRMEDDGSIRCAFRVEKKHLNGAKNVHGGCFMSFADYCLFATAAPILQGPGVTLSFACEFLAAVARGRADRRPLRDHPRRQLDHLPARHAHLRRQAGVLVLRLDQAHGAEDPAAVST